MELKLKSDTAKRKRFFTPESFSHPAKCHLGMLEWIILEYSKEGDVILDPMCGSGSILYATLLGRSVICVDLESKFIRMCEANWQKMQTMPLQLGISQRGWAQIIQGDARNLEGVLADAAIFSPPFAGEQVDNRQTYNPTILSRTGYGQAKRDKYSNDNIANLPYGNIDAAIFSPPFGGSEQFQDLDFIGKHRKRPHNPEQGQGGIGSLPYGSIDAVKADAIITSPPYEGTEYKEDYEFYRKRQMREIPTKTGTRGIPTEKAMRQQVGGLQAESPANIGNLKSTDYLSAMFQVYSQCYKCLRPGGVMCLVVKPFIRNKKVVHLERDTQKLCESAGFQFVEEHHRRLTQMSFWRTIYYAKNPEVERVDKEYILCFTKP